MKSHTVLIKKDVLLSWLKVTANTQSDLANQLQVSKGRISQLIHSNVEPSAHLIAKLLVVTELPFERLFDVTEDPLFRTAKQREGKR